MELPADKIISCFYDSSADCVKVIDTSGSLMSFNPKGLEAMEIDDPKSVLGRNWLGFWSGDIRPRADDAFKRALEGKPGSFEGFCPTFKGTPKWWQVSVVPLFNEYNEVQWILAVSRDATELRNLREEVQSLRTRVAELA